MILLVNYTLGDTTMARGRKTTYSSSKSTRRNAIPSTYRYTPPRVLRLTIMPRPYVAPLILRKSPVKARWVNRNAIPGDRRFFNPGRRVESPHSVLKRDAQLVIPRYRNPFKSLPSQLAFRTPDRVALCRRRHARRSVLFAIRLAGKRGTGAGTTKRRDIYSHVSCKR